MKSERSVALPAPTRERLLAAAGELIEEGGYGAASVAAIAERAEVAAGTLYRHFASKQELFVEVLRRVCTHEERVMRGAVDAAGRAGGLERMAIVLGTFSRHALLKPRLAWALMAESADPLVDAERLAYRERYAALLAECLRMAIAAGEVPEQNPEFTAAALVGGCGEALIGPLSPLAASPPDDEQIISAICTFARRAAGGAG